MDRPSRRALGLAVTAAAALAHPCPAPAQVALGVGKVLHVQTTTSASTNCTNLRQVLAGISGGSSSNRFLVKLPPGQFSCGTQTVPVKPWVTLEGSGYTTSISGDPGVLGVVNLENESEVRSLKVTAKGLSASAEAAIVVFSLDHAIAARLFEVDVVGTNLGSGDGYGLLISTPGGSQVAIDHSEVHGGTAAVWLSASTSIFAKFSLLTCETSGCSVLAGPGSGQCVATYSGFSLLNPFCT